MLASEGNVHQIRNPLTAGKLTASLCETYGPAHRIHGVLGVGRLTAVSYHVFSAPLPDLAS